MLAIMGAALRRVLDLLQTVAYARVQCECMRLSGSRFPQAGPRRFDYQQRIDRSVRELHALQGGMSPEERSAVRLGRALFLQLLLASAPQRLDAWCDSETLDTMPPSHLLEWVAYDDERTELAEVESTMTPEEAVLYARARIHLASQESI
ncbi:hypothetical protein [Variovorax sp. GT1P44]|uniref:hypothetical protein n=1 Tax=Variovorax sp. GT1P44 TaxID=3443742 RepID=UPI003F48CEC1